MSVNVKQNGALTKVGGLYKEPIPMSVAEYYSTDEHKVGVWVDGKPLYQRTVTATSNVATQDGSWADISGAMSPTISNAEKLVDAQLHGTVNIDYSQLRFTVDSGVIKCASKVSGNGWYTGLVVTFFYTKTSDNATGGVYAPIIPMQMASKYSTEEKVVGQWTDGKPLYQRTFQTTSASQVNSSTLAVDLSSYNVENVIIQDGFIKTANNITPHGGQSFILWYREADDAIYHQVTNSAYISSDMFITVQYTKTTDTANTGLFSDDEATLGMLGDVDLENLADGDIIRYNGTSGKFENVPKEEYSTDEQVIGKWVDGSTLYRKVFTNTGSSITCTSNTWVNVSFATVTNLGRVIDAKVYDSNNTEFVGCISKDNNMLAFYNIRNASVILDSGSQVIMTYTKSSS